MSSSDNLLADLTLLQPLWLIPALILAWMATRIGQQTTLHDWHRVMHPGLWHYLVGNAPARRRFNRRLFAAALLCLALSTPAHRRIDADAYLYTTGWIAILDVSRSMSVEDVAPTRLGAARRALKSLSAAAGARPLALVVYAGDAFLAIPPAFDRRSFDELAALIDVGVVPLDGSDVGRALSLATAVAIDSNFLDARLFLLSDSGGITSSALEAAEYLNSYDYQLDVLLFGLDSDTPEATDIPAEPTGSPAQVDARASLRLSEQGGGSLLRAGALGMRNLDDWLDEGSTTTGSQARQSIVWQPLSHWLLLPLLPLLLGEFRGRGGHTSRAQGT